MQPIAIIEFTSALFFGFTLFGAFSRRSDSVGSRRLVVCMAVMFVTLIIDALSYVCVGPSYPLWFRYALNIFSYTAATFNLCAFLRYEQAVIGRGKHLGKWTYVIPLALEAVFLVCTLYELFFGSVLVYDNDVEVLSGPLPTYILAMRGLDLLYLAAVPLFNREKIGKQNGVLMCLFMLTPIIGLIPLYAANLDLTYILGALALYLLSEFVQKQHLRRALDDAYRESTRNDLLLDTLNLGRWSYRLDGNGNIVSYDYSDRMLEFIGSDGDHPHLTLDQCIHPEDRARVTSAFAAALKDTSGRTIYDETFRLLPKGGAELWVRSAGRVIPRSDGSADFVGMINDLTSQMDQRRELMAASELALRQRRLKAFGDMVNAALWSMDIDGDANIVKVEWSNEFRRMFGFEETEADFPNTIEAWSSRLHPEDREHTLEHFNRGIRSNDVTGYVYDIEYRIKRKSGEYRWYRAVGRMDHTKDGLKQMFGIIYDISDAKQVEAQQKQLKTNLEIIGALASDYSSVYYVDLKSDRFALYSSESEPASSFMSAVFRRHELFKDAIDTYIEHFVYQPDRERMYRECSRETVLENLAALRSYTVSFRGVYRGNVTFCSVKFVAVRRDGKEISGANVCFSYRDREIMANFVDEKLAAEYLSIYVVDLDNNKFRTYRRSAATQPLERADRVWSTAISNFAEEIDPEYNALMRNIGDPHFLKNRLIHTDRCEYRYRTLDETNPWRNAIIQVVDRTDGEAGTVIVSFACTDDYQARILEQQRQLVQQQKELENALSMAQSANRAKTVFLNNMSHDIRTPMNAIIGYTELAENHLDNREQVHDYLAKINQSSKHLLSLINDVLDMSRIESGKMTLDEKEESLAEIIHTLGDIEQADVRAKQLDLTIAAENVNDETILCDRLRVNQVLLNVLSNAVKYTPAGGKILLRVTEDAPAKEGIAAYTFTVKDTGIGMDKEFLKTIFEPFTRMKSSTVSGIQGTGLGMAITKTLTDMMHGTVAIESEPGKGTEVTLHFSFRLAPCCAESREIPVLSGKTALVASGDPSVTASAEKMLTEAGCTPVCCASGAEALARASAPENAPILLIIDGTLSDMSGTEAVRRVRALPGQKDSAILLLTGCIGLPAGEDPYAAGVSSVLTKPLFHTDLCRALGEHFGKACCGQTSGPAAFDFTGKKVLLAEDNEMNREIATDILTENGFIVDTAEDGDIAVEKIRSAKPGDYDIVLMDIQMPRMNGYEATRAIRALGTEISKLPIIAMTANAFEEDRKLALEAGMNEHFTKPINVDALKATLARFL